MKNLSHMGSRISRFGIVACAALAISLGAAPASAGQAPIGFSLMCLKHPEQCKQQGPAKVEASKNIMATLKQVNARVNRSIAPRNDGGGADVWTVGATVGDCEDYVIAKRAALIKAGLPASSLRIAYVKTKRGEGHAVLVVKTNGKDLVLDNLTATIKPLSQTGYRVISVSGANPLKWS